MKKAVFGILGAATLCAVAAWADSSTMQMQSPSIARNESLDKNMEQQLKPAMTAFEAAWNKHDAQGMAAIFADDAVLINPYGRLARGRPEIQKLFQDEQRGAMKDTQFSSRITDLRQPAPGVVLVDQEITLSGMRDPSGSPQPDVHFHNPMLMTNKTGKWLVLDSRPYRFSKPPQQPAVGGSGAGSNTGSSGGSNNGSGGSSHEGGTHY